MTRAAGPGDMSALELKANIAAFRLTPVEAARAAEVALVRGNDPGLLHGLPVSVKDLIAVGACG